MENAYKLITMMWLDDRCEVFVQQLWRAVYYGLKEKQFKEYDVYCAIIINEWEENPEKCYEEADRYIHDVLCNIPTKENPNKEWEDTEPIKKARANDEYVRRNL